MDININNMAREECVKFKETTVKTLTLILDILQMNCTEIIKLLINKIIL